VVTNTLSDALTKSPTDMAMQFQLPQQMGGVALSLPDAGFTETIPNMPKNPGRLPPFIQASRAMC